ncbi:hypothetical protein LUU34_00746800 [Aix galericulata]|nr:hypothetical protein LUU34_00746800 [Aix galericulata]
MAVGTGTVPPRASCPGRSPLPEPPGEVKPQVRALSPSPPGVPDRPHGPVPFLGPYCRDAGPAASPLVTNWSSVTVLFSSTSHRSGRGLLLSYASSQHPGGGGWSPRGVGSSSPTPGWLLSLPDPKIMPPRDPEVVFFLLPGGTVEAGGAGEVMGGGRLSWGPPDLGPQPQGARRRRSPSPSGGDLGVGDKILQQEQDLGRGWGAPGAGGSREPLTRRCPCLADVVSCLKRGTHLSQEHTRCVPAPLGAPQPVPSSAPCPQPSPGAGLAGGVLGVQPQLLCRGEDTFRGTKPPGGVRGVAALTPPPRCSVYCPAGCKDIEGDIWGNARQGYRDTSVLCKAAVHAGVIADETGGQVTLSQEKGITLYESAFANGLHSKRWGFPLGEASPVPQRYFSHELGHRFDPKRCRRHPVWGPQQRPGPQLPPPLAACGDTLEVAAFNASSWWQEVDALGQERGWAAERAALGTPGPSWAAEPGAEAAWLELDLGTRRNVTAACGAEQAHVVLLHPLPASAFCSLAANGGFVRRRRRKMGTLWGRGRREERSRGGHRLLGAERGPWVFPEGGGGDTQGASCPPGIVTKGSEMCDCYVMSYGVSSSRDGRNWRPYRGSGGQEDKVFEGNVDSRGEVSNAFIPPIVTRYLRVTPHSWHQRIAMKVALLGCPMARVRAPRPYAPSDPQEVPLPVPTSRSPGRTPIPGVALDPKKAGGCPVGLSPLSWLPAVGSWHPWVPRGHGRWRGADATLRPQTPRCWCCCSLVASCSAAASCCWPSSAAGGGGSRPAAPSPKTASGCWLCPGGGRRDPTSTGGAGQPLILLSPRRKPAAELNCGTVKGYPKLESSQVCSLGSLPPPGSTLPSFPAAAALGDLSQPHSPEYAEPDLVQVSPSGQPGPSTFKPPPDEGYTLPLVVSHYAVPGQYHEYAEPLPPEPEYATPFGDPEPLGTRRSPCGMAGLPAALSCAGSPESPLARYDAPTLLPGEPQGLSGVNAAPRGELPPGPHGDSPSPERPHSHVYHEAWGPSPAVLCLSPRALGRRHSRLPAAPRAKIVLPKSLDVDSAGAAEAPPCHARQKPFLAPRPAPPRPESARTPSRSWRLHLPL